MSLTLTQIVEAVAANAAYRNQLGEIAKQEGASAILRVAQIKDCSAEEQSTLAKIIAGAPGAIFALLSPTGDKGRELLAYLEGKELPVAGKPATKADDRDTVICTITEINGSFPLIKEWIERLVAEQATFHHLDNTRGLANIKAITFSTLAGGKWEDRENHETPVLTIGGLRAFIGRAVSNIAGQGKKSKAQKCAEDAIALIYPGKRVSRMSFTLVCQYATYVDLDVDKVAEALRNSELGVELDTAYGNTRPAPSDDAPHGVASATEIAKAAIHAPQPTLAEGAILSIG